MKYKLDYLTKKCGLKQTHIAKSIGIHPRYLSDMKNGRQKVSENVMEKLEELYGRFGGR